MSRSSKKAIFKDNWGKKGYWKRVRSRQRNEMRSGVHPEDVSNPKTLINDYDYCEYKTDLENNPEIEKYSWVKELRKKLKRK